MFFFEKKNQKTFVRLRTPSMTATETPSLRAKRSNPALTCHHNARPASSPAQTDKSLFASFSSEKEESFP
jgi:hypothetical protein